MKLSWKDKVRKSTFPKTNDPYLRIRVFEGGGTERIPYDGFVVKNGCVYYYAIMVGTNWLNKNLNKIQFAEYVADRMKSEDGWF